MSTLACLSDLQTATEKRSPEVLPGCCLQVLHKQTKYLVQYLIKMWISKQTVRDDMNKGVYNSKTNF